MPPTDDINLPDSPIDDPRQPKRERKRKNDDTDPSATRDDYTPLRVRLTQQLYRFPYWALLLVVVAVLIFQLVRSDEIYSGIFEQLSEGIGMTLGVTAAAYVSALTIALIVGVIRAFPPQPGHGLLGSIFGAFRVLIYNIATLYVEVMRGLPILVSILIMAFVLFPILRDDVLEPLLGYEIQVRAGSPLPAVFALAMAYGAFMSETLRAGIQSIERGQREAARSLGMTSFQVLRFVVLPQAVRRVLPPLGNDFVAMIKDSALVSILGIRDVTQLARLSSGRSFRYLETYLIVALIYLTMTILGSQIVRILERRLNQSRD